MEENQNLEKQKDAKQTAELPAQIDEPKSE